VCGVACGEMCRKMHSWIGVVFAGNVLSVDC